MFHYRKPHSENFLFLIPAPMEDVASRTLPRDIASRTLPRAERGGEGGSKMVEKVKFSE